MQAYLLIFLGAGIGGCLRQAITLLAAKLLGTHFPWGTFAINITGSTVIGLLAGFLAFHVGEAWTQQARLFALTGILGGYTTFSSFSLDAAMLFERGEYMLSASYVGGSVALALIGVFAGLALMRVIS